MANQGGDAVPAMSVLAAATGASPARRPATAGRGRARPEPTAPLVAPLIAPGATPSLLPPAHGAPPAAPRPRAAPAPRPVAAPALAGAAGAAGGEKAVDASALLATVGLQGTGDLTKTLAEPDGATWVQLCRELQQRPELRWLTIDDRTVRFLKDVRSMGKKEREMYLLVILKEGREEPPVRQPGDTRVRRAKYTYSVQPFGRMTRKAFCTLFDIRSKYLRNLQAHLAEHNSVIPRTHGNVGRVPNNRKLAREHVQFAEGWIREFGRRNGHPETVRIRHRVGDKVEIVRRQVLVITTSTSVAQLHKHFREAFAQAFPGANCFGEETFRRILHTVDDVRIRRNTF